MGEGQSADPAHQAVAGCPIQASPPWRTSWNGGFSLPERGGLQGLYHTLQLQFCRPPQSFFLRSASGALFKGDVVPEALRSFLLPFPALKYWQVARISRGPYLPLVGKVGLFSSQKGSTIVARPVSRGTVGNRCNSFCRRPAPRERSERSAHINCADGPRYTLRVGELPNPAAITIRPAVAEDADTITRIYLESAEYHARLDPERYWIPAVETISARYREGRQHPPDAEGNSITLVAELGGAIVGFIDARLDRSPDPMHREILYCHVVEIAVAGRYQNQGIGQRLLEAIENWGRGQGAELASLEYLTANTRAADFYQRRTGYRPAAVTAVKRL